MHQRRAATRCRPDRPRRCAHNLGRFRCQKMPRGGDEVLRRPLHRRDCRVAARLAGHRPARLEACQALAAARVEYQGRPMTEERRRQIEEIVLSMLALKSAERAARLDSACGHDDDLRREVESLLAQETRAGTFLEVPALDAAARVLTDGHSDLLPGSTVGPYRIDAFLGAGGMGEVYRAWDTRLRRAVALKFLPREYLSDSAALERFQREARAASALSHPNICVVHDIGDFDGRPFIAMEYLEGQTLRALMSGGALPQCTALEYASQIVQGLTAAHQKGVVHRDLKPENLWITGGGRLKILDFGLAKVDAPMCQSESSAVSLSEPGRIMGTVGYMSPEQVRGQSLDHRTDLFAFGAILFEMVAG